MRAAEGTDLEEEGCAHADGDGCAAAEPCSYGDCGAEGVYAGWCSSVCEREEEVEEGCCGGAVYLPRGFGNLGGDIVDVWL